LPFGPWRNQLRINVSAQLGEYQSPILGSHLDQSHFKQPRHDELVEVVFRYSPSRSRRASCSRIESGAIHRPRRVIPRANGNREGKKLDHASATLLRLISAIASAWADFQSRRFATGWDFRSITSHAICHKASSESVMLATDRSSSDSKIRDSCVSFMQHRRPAAIRRWHLPLSFALWRRFDSDVGECSRIDQIGSNRLGSGDRQIGYHHRFRTIPSHGNEPIFVTIFDLCLHD